MVEQQRVKRGFVSIATILVLLVVVATITLNALTVQIDNNTIFKTFADGSKARANANSCVEIAINKLKENLNYVGNEIFNTSHGTCQIVSITGTGNVNRVISTSGLYNSNTRKVKVNISVVNPTTSITSWLEVDVF